MFCLDIFRKLIRTTQDQRAVIFKGNNFPIVIKTNERKIRQRVREMERGS